MSDHIATVNEALELICHGAVDNGCPLSILDSFLLQRIAYYVQDDRIQLDALKSSLSQLDSSVPQYYAAGVWRICASYGSMDPRLRITDHAIIYCERVPFTLFVLFPSGSPLKGCMLGIVTESGGVFDDSLVCKIVASEGSGERLVIRAGSWSCKHVDDDSLDSQGALNRIGQWSYFAQEHIFLGPEHIFVYFNDCSGRERSVLMLSMSSRSDDVVVLRRAEGLFVPLRECANCRDPAFMQEFVANLELYLFCIPLRISCSESQSDEFIRLLLTAGSCLESSAVVPRVFQLFVSRVPVLSHDGLMDACSLLEDYPCEKGLLEETVRYLLEHCEKLGGEPDVVERLLVVFVSFLKDNEDANRRGLFSLLGMVPDSVMRNMCSNCIDNSDASLQQFDVVLQFVCECMLDSRDEECCISAGEVIRRCVNLENGISSQLLKYLVHPDGFGELIIPANVELISLCAVLLETFSIPQLVFDTWAKQFDLGDCCISLLVLLCDHTIRLHSYERFLKVLYRCVTSKLFTDGDVPISLLLLVQEFFLQNYLATGSTSVRTFCQLFCTLVEVLGRNQPLAPEMVDVLLKSLSNHRGNFDASFAIVDCLLVVVTMPGSLEQFAVAASTASGIDTLVQLSQRFSGRPTIVSRISELLVQLVTLSTSCQEEDCILLTECIKESLLRYSDSPLTVNCPQLAALLSEHTSDQKV